MEQRTVATADRATADPLGADAVPLDHTLGARPEQVEVGAGNGLPAARLGILRWPPAPGADDPRQGADDRPRWRRPGAPASREVVFLHGLSGSAATQAPVGAWLAAEGWSVRAIDLPGHGRSTWLADTGAPISDPEALDASAYGLDRVAGVVARAIAALELSERPALVGHSWGAGIAAAAVLEAAPVTRLILVDPPFVTAEGALMIASGLVDELRPDIESATAVARGEEPEADPVELAARAEALSQASAAAIMAAATQTGYGPFEFLARWRAARPRIRVDMICGNPALGSLVPGRVRLLLRLLLGPSHVHYFRDSGHSPQRTHFAEFMAVLGRLLRAA